MHPRSGLLIIISIMPKGILIGSVQNCPGFSNIKMGSRMMMEFGNSYKDVLSDNRIVYVYLANPLATQLEEPIVGSLKEYSSGWQSYTWGNRSLEKRYSAPGRPPSAIRREDRKSHWNDPLNDPLRCSRIARNDELRHSPAPGFGIS